MKHRNMTTLAFAVGLALLLAACSSGGGLVKTIFVGPTMVDCVGVGPQQCILIKEDPDEDWQLWYDSIEGLDYEEGFLYELQVEEITNENPPADASSITLRLKEVVSKEPVEPLPLEGTEWELVTYSHGDQEMISVLSETKITALFEGGTVAGSAGCNRYTAGYEVQGDKISISMPATTLMACPEPIMEQETQYLAGLETAATYQVTADRMEIRTESGELTLVFAAAEPMTLEGTPWEVIGYNNGKQAVVSVIIGTEITAFFEDGTVSGSAGCNTYSASYEVDGSKITIGVPATTRMFCNEPEGVMEQETQYLAALESAATFEIREGRLEMFNDSGARALSFLVAQAES